MSYSCRVTSEEILGGTPRNNFKEISEDTHLTHSSEGNLRANPVIYTSVRGRKGNGLFNPFLVLAIALII